MHARFQRGIGSLDDVFLLSQEFCRTHGIGEDQRRRVDFVLEELFTNLIKYGHGDGDEVEIGLERNADRLIVSITDFDADHFDIRDLEDANIDLSLAERQPGGLGIHLVKKFVDQIDYDHHDRLSTIKLTIHLR